MKDRQGFLKKHHDRWYVGAIDGDYHGPTAEITFDKDWLHIITDYYEGHAMLNIEALPKLRKALGEIAKQRRETASSA